MTEVKVVVHESTWEFTHVQLTWSYSVTGICFLLLPGEVLAGPRAVREASLGHGPLK